jgi:hypothetical protein
MGRFCAYLLPIAASLLIYRANWQKIPVSKEIGESVQAFLIYFNNAAAGGTS